MSTPAKNVTSINIRYEAEPTLKAFHRSNAKVRGVLGPIGCLPYWTEVMTPDGWIRISEWKGQDILQWDSATGKSYFAKPKDYISGGASEFIRFSIGEKRTMTVTPNHRVALYDWDGKFCVKSAEQLSKKLSKHTLPTTWDMDSEGVPMSNNELRLWTAVAADGHYPKHGKQCVFTLRRERKIDRIEALLNDMGIEYTKAFSVREGTKEYRITFSRPSHSKHLDWSLAKCSRRQAEIIVEEAKHWDGLHDSSFDRFDSCCEIDADIIQYLCHCVGRNTSKGLKISTNDKWSDGHVVCIARNGSPKNKVCIRVDGTTIDRRTLDNQYCFETDTGFFVVRQEGFIFITGNSGKSSACVMEIFIRACAQTPDMNGVRSTRWAIVRNTYAELITTTMVTFRKWFYEPICNYKSDRPLSARIKMPLGDGTSIDCEVLFLACDRAEDAGKFRSLEITGAWVNEASQIEKGVVDVIQGRCGRFPSKWYNQNNEEVGGPTWFGMIMDTNAPDDESWWYKCAEVEKPEGWRFFMQPPAVLLAPDSTPAKPIYVPNEGQNPSIPAAENVKHIPTGWSYYMDQIAGKPYEYIKVFLMAQYGTVAYGRPVYPEYSDVIHYAPTALATPDGKAGELLVYNGLPLFLGWDFGVQHSACVIAQLSPKGQLRVIQEILGENCGIRQFARELVVPLLRNSYNGAKIVSTGDPAGSSRASTDEQTCMQILNEEGVPTQPCSTNSPVARREAVRYFLNRMVNGEAGILIGEKCPTIRKGFLGRYCFKRMTSSTLGEAYSGDPLKDIHSHPHDALQYIAVRITSGDTSYTEARKFMMDREKYSGLTMPQQTAGVPVDIDMKGFF